MLQPRAASINANSICGQLQNYLWGLFSREFISFLPLLHIGKARFGLGSRAFVQNAGLDPVDLNSCWAMNMNRIGAIGNAKSPRTMISHLNLNARLSAFVLVVHCNFPTIILATTFQPCRAPPTVRCNYRPSFHPILFSYVWTRLWFTIFILTGLFVFSIKLILFSSWL
jgi:hypothetical protein